MKKEECCNRDKLFFIGRQTKRRKRFFAIKAAVIIGLLLTLFPPLSLAGPLDNYVIGGGGEFQCLPPEDKTPCAEVIFFPRLSLLWPAITKECGDMVNSPDFQERYKMVAPFLLIPGGIEIVAAYAFSSGLDDFASCILKGWCEYKGNTALKSKVDHWFAAKDLYDLKKSLGELNLQMDDRALRDAIASDSLDAKDTVSSSKDVVTDMTEIKTMRQLVREYSDGVFGQGRNMLEISDEDIRICQFEEAEARIRNAEALVKTYFEKRGSQYRWLEKNIRCLKENYQKWLSERDQYSLKNLPLETPLEIKRDFERMEQRLRQTLRGFESSINEQKDLLTQWENEILSNLKIYEEVKNKRKILEEKKRDFARKKREYDEEKEKAASALRKEDLKQACEILIRIKEMEKDGQRISPECAQKLYGIGEGKFWGDFLEKALQNKASEFTQVIEDYLKMVKKAMERPCELDVARNKLAESQAIFGKIRIYSEGTCVSSLDLEKKIREVETQFNIITENDTAARKLLERAEKLANHECTYDQALSGETAEEKIRDYIKKGCMKEDEVDTRLRRIKWLVEAFQKKAEVEEKVIFEKIASLHELINPTIPKCDLEGANKALWEAENRFREHLACESADPRPSDVVRARADRVRAGLETARQFIISRSLDINEAQRKYRQMVSSLLTKTDDPCHYKEAMSQQLRESLMGWARDFCKPEEANKDIQAIEDAIKKWDERIRKDMEALRQAVAAVGREKSCQVAEEVLKKQKDNLSYLKDCEGYKEPIKKDFETMEDIISKKKKEADQKVQQALNAGQNALAKCVNLEQALNQLKQVKSMVHESCLSSILLDKRNNLAEKLEQQIWDIEDRKKGVYVLLGEAEKTLKTCEWDAMESQLSEAKQTLPGEPCFSGQPAFSGLKRGIQDLESRKETRKKDIEKYQAWARIYLRNSRAYLEKKNRGELRGAALQKAYNDNIADLNTFIQGVETASLTDCLDDIVRQVRDMLAQMGGSPRDSIDQSSATLGEPSRDSVDQASARCANKWPGSVPILDQNNRISCICPSEKGLVWNQNRTRCISCAEYENRFVAAVNSNDLNSAQGLLNEAVNCPWYSKGASALEQRRRHQERCKQIDADLIAASEAKDINRFRALVEQARAEKCDFYQKAYNHLQKWERCVQINSALAAASKAKDINRFRALVEQARVENCDFYQNAYNHLRNWEQQLQRSATQPPPRTPVQPQQQPPPPKPSPPVDNIKWFVWHDCKGKKGACHIQLSTEQMLRQRGVGVTMKGVTVMGIYNTEKEARQATCGKITDIQPGGTFGIRGKIGKDTYSVGVFIYWDNREKRYKCISASD